MTIGNTFDQDDQPNNPLLSGAAVRRKLGSKTLFLLLSVSIIGCGLGRAWYATRLDAPTIDEAWHVVAGASYVRTGDYRLNPEHPPLVKLWMGAWLPEGSFVLPPFRHLVDKRDERDFTDDTFQLKNDPDRVQGRARVAMLVFNGLLLFGLGWSVLPIFGQGVTLATLALLAIDPTIAAHLPVVLTDLPVALLSSIAVALAFLAFRSWRIVPLVLASLALGLTLAAKHSGVVVMGAVGLIGIGMVAWGERDRWRAVWLRRACAIAAVLLGAYAVLWATYGFRFAESPLGLGSDGTLSFFNRPLADKINDLRSETTRAILWLCSDWHLLPRAYLWGLADIVRAGVEGRQEVFYLFGQRLEGDTPWYFFPAVLAVKLPLGVLVLALGGVVLAVRRRSPLSPQVKAGIAALAACGAFFMLALMRGNSGYAGVRHAIPVIPVLAILAAVALTSALQPGAPEAPAVRWWRRGALLLLGLSLVSALPLMRPWEYYNEIVGGADDAWRQFSDDGLDNSQRTRELASYYDAHVRGTAERAYDFYGMYDEEVQSRGLSFAELDATSNVIEGTVFMNARELAVRPTYDLAAFRDAAPAARFGNLFVYKGRFEVPWLAAAEKRAEAVDALAPQHADTARAARLLAEVVAVYPQDYQSSFELGNLYVERGEIPAAIAAYELSRKHSPPGDRVAGLLTEQIQALSEGKSAPQTIRNPWAE